MVLVTRSAGFDAGVERDVVWAFTSSQLLCEFDGDCFHLRVLAQSILTTARPSTHSFGMVFIVNTLSQKSGVNLNLLLLQGQADGKIMSKCKTSTLLLYLFGSDLVVVLLTALVHFQTFCSLRMEPEHGVHCSSSPLGGAQDTITNTLTQLQTHVFHLLIFVMKKEFIQLFIQIFRVCFKWQ